MTEENLIRPHPGQLLRTQVLKPRKLSVVKSAKLLGVSRNYLSRVISGNRDLSLDLCHRVAILFGENAEDWATKQMQHDLDKKGVEVRKLNLKPYDPNKTLELK